MAEDKVDRQTARATPGALRTLTPIGGVAKGLTPWRYGGGPWQLDRHFALG